MAQCFRRNCGDAAYKVAGRQVLRGIPAGRRTSRSGVRRTQKAGTHQANNQRSGMREMAAFRLLVRFFSSATVATKLTAARNDDVCQGETPGYL